MGYWKSLFTRSSFTHENDQTKQIAQDRTEEQKELEQRQQQWIQLSRIASHDIASSLTQYRNCRKQRVLHIGKRGTQQEGELGNGHGWDESVERK